MAENSLKSERYRIRREVPVPVTVLKYIGEVHWNYKLLWGLVALGLAVLGASLTLVFAHSFRLASALVVLIFAIFYVLVVYEPLEGNQTSLLAKGSRMLFHLVDNVTGRSNFVSDRAGLGEITESTPKARRRKPKKPELFSEVDIEPYDRDGEVWGIVRDRHNGTLSATMRWYFSSLYSGDDQTRKHVMSGFAQLLDRAAEEGHTVHRIVWRDQTLKGEYQDPEEKIAQIARGAGLNLRQGPGLEELKQNLANEGERSFSRRTTVTVTIKTGQTKFEARQLGSSQEVLVQRVLGFDALATGRGIGSSPIGLSHSEILDYNDLVLESRLLLDPVYAQPIVDGRSWGGLSHPGELLDEAVAWPNHYDFKPMSHCVWGETHHICGYLSNFPAWGIGSEDLEEIIDVPVSKTITAIFEVLPMKKARKRIRYRKVGARGMMEEMEGYGREPDAFQEESYLSFREHEMQLATSGHQSVRSRVYLDVVGETLADAQADNLRIRRAFGDKSILYQPLTAQQHLGIEATSLTGRGLS
jgi:hypothetical protein